jgi:hypothetical protein
MVVRGHDKLRRAVLTKMVRMAPSTDELAYILAQLYVGERALAATEVCSLGNQEQIMMVFDFNNYSSTNSPSYTTLRKTLNIFQSFYPERVAKLFILNPPLWIRSVYATISFLLAKETQAKIMIMAAQCGTKDSVVSSSNFSLISQYLDPSQAMPFLIPTGELLGDVDVHQFIQNVPFHSLYDEV